MWLCMVAPKGRKHLSADALFDFVQSGFADIPEYCLSDTDISLADALMSAFAMFSLKSSSLLAFEGLCTSSLRLISAICKPGKMPSLQPLV